QTDGMAGLQMLPEPRDGRRVETMHELGGNDLTGERRDLRGLEPRQVRLVLLERMDAARRQIAHEKERKGGELRRPLPPLQCEETPELPLGAAANERSVDVENGKRHCLRPGSFKMSCLCEYTNSTMTGKPRATHNSTAR